jgi:hypothetical protein
VADIPFPRDVHNELISDGLAQPHRGGFPAVVSYRVFRMSYERARVAERRDGRRDD